MPVANRKHLVRTVAADRCGWPTILTLPKKSGVSGRCDMTNRNAAKPRPFDCSSFAHII